MTKPGSPTFCVANNIDIGYFNGQEVYLRSVRERNEALHSYINHFCLNGKLDAVRFREIIEELKPKFTMVKNCISLENVNGFYQVLK